MSVTVKRRSVRGEYVVIDPTTGEELPYRPVSHPPRPEGSVVLQRLTDGWIDEHDVAWYRASNGRWTHA